MRIKITKPGIFDSTGKEIAVGTQLTVKEEPKGWRGRYEVVEGSTEGKTAVTNPAQGPAQQPAGAYAVKDKGRGWFVITKDGEEATKSLRADDVEGFDELSDEDKAAYVEANKAED